MSLTVRQIQHGSPDYDEAVALRRRLLRAPLGLDFTLEQLTAEADDLHLAGFDGDLLVATVVLSPYDSVSLKLRQMAVDAERQGSGTGSRLLAAAEKLALDNGMTRMVLSARVSARGFYARNGYTAEGDVFTEVTLPHIRLVKMLA